jgi:hypothetical protein
LECSLDRVDAVFETLVGKSVGPFRRLGSARDLLINFNHPDSTPLTAEIKVVSQDGTVVDARQWKLVPTGSQAWANSAPEGGLSFNAGKPMITLCVNESSLLRMRSLSVK